MIVHGGHAEDDIAEGPGRWLRSLEMLETEVPVLIENTAGGENAVARRFDALARLWDAIGDADHGIELGFCFDTCHAHAAGEELGDAVERVLAITGGIDLLHANDSRDPAGTGADRHAHLGKGKIDLEALRADDQRRPRRGARGGGRDPRPARRAARRHRVRARAGLSSAPLRPLASRRAAAAGPGSPVVRAARTKSAQ